MVRSRKARLYFKDNDFMKREKIKIKTDKMHGEKSNLNREEGVKTMFKIYLKNNRLVIPQSADHKIHIYIY